MTYVANITSWKPGQSGNPKGGRLKPIDSSTWNRVLAEYQQRRLGRWRIPAKTLAGLLGLSQRQFYRVARLVALAQADMPAKHSRAALGSGRHRTHQEAITAAQWRTPPQVGV